MRLVLPLIVLLAPLAFAGAQAPTPTDDPDTETPLPRDEAVRDALRTLDAAGDEDDPLGVGDVASLRDVPVRTPTVAPPPPLRVPPEVGEVLAAIPGVRQTEHRIDVRWTHGLALVREEIVLRSNADYVAEARLRLPRPADAWLVSAQACVDELVPSAAGTRPSTSSADPGTPRRRERCVSALPDASTRYDARWIDAALAPREAVEAPATADAPRLASTSSPIDMRREPLLAADAHVDARGPAFSIHVAPLEPGGARTVRVVWAAPLSILGGVARFAIPARGNDLRASPARVRFEPGDVLAPLLQGSSPDAAVDVDPWSPIELAGRLPAGSLRTSAVSFPCGRERCVYVHLAAGSREGPAQHVALLIDVSPSTFGPARGRLAPTLTALLAALPHGSDVRAWTFAARAHTLLESPTPPTEVPFAALASAGTHELGASTRLDVALSAIEDLRHTHVIVIGDGGLTEGPHLEASLADAARRGARLSLLSLTDRPPHPALTAAVTRLGGRTIRIPDALFDPREAASLDGRVAALFAPSLGDARVGRVRLGELRAGEALHHVGVLPRGARVALGRLDVIVRSAGSTADVIAGSAGSTADVIAGSARSTADVRIRPTRDVGFASALAALGRAEAGEPTRLAYVPAPRDPSTIGAASPRRTNDRANDPSTPPTCETLTRLVSAPAPTAARRDDPWMSADVRSCDLPTAPPAPPSRLGRGIPAETVLSMLRRRVVPVARACFRRDRAGREDYSTRAVFELRLTDREVASADVVGEIDAELRTCLLHAVDGLDVPAYDGTIVVRYPLYTQRHGPSVTIELHPTVADAVDRVLPVENEAEPSTGGSSTR